MKRVAFVFALFAFGCGGDDGPSYETLREAAIATCDAFCEREVECGYFGPADLDRCRSDCVSAVCGQTCDRDFTGSADGIDKCVEAFDNYNCAAEMPPAECLGVVH